MDRNNHKILETLTIFRQKIFANVIFGTQTAIFIFEFFKRFGEIGQRRLNIKSFDGVRDFF